MKHIFYESNMFWIFLVFIGIGGIFVYSGLSLAPWVPTRKKDVERFLQILEMKSEENFLEVGAGDARISRAVAKKFPENTISGIDIFFPLLFLQKIRQKIFGPKNLKLQYKNVYNENFGNFDHIYIFGMPDKMQTKILPKFLQEAKSGAKLYSYTFSIPENFGGKKSSIGEKKEAKFHILEKI